MALSPTHLAQAFDLVVARILRAYADQRVEDVLIETNATGVTTYSFRVQESADE